MAWFKRAKAWKRAEHRKLNGQTQEAEWSEWSDNGMLQSPKQMIYSNTQVTWTMRGVIIFKPLNDYICFLKITISYTHISIQHTFRTIHTCNKT